MVGEEMLKSYAKNLQKGILKNSAYLRILGCPKIKGG